MAEGETGDTARIRAVAPTLAELPRFTRRLPATAAWAGVSLLFAGAAALFWRTVSLGTDAAVMHHDIIALEGGLADLKAVRDSQEALSKDFSVVKSQNAQLMYDHAVAEWVLQADYNRHHRLPVPPPPQPPGQLSLSR